jgi:hypothetical protein
MAKRKDLIMVVIFPFFLFLHLRASAKKPGIYCMWLARRFHDAADKAVNLQEPKRLEQA